MATITDRFKGLGVDNAPGQHSSKEDVEQQISDALIGDPLEGRTVDFSHGDVDAFPPPPGSFEHFEAGVEEGSTQAYTEYRGRKTLRDDLADSLGRFTGTTVDPNRELILTPGTQGALFLAISSLVATGDRVAIVDPDYFANRKLVEFFGASPVSVSLHFEDAAKVPELDLKTLEDVFASGVKTFLFSNPNNPTGVVYRLAQLEEVARLARQYDVTVIVDQLYSRQIFAGVEYHHLRAQPEMMTNTITIMGPSKTESLSGYRLGVAFGPEHLVARMEKVQAITTLRAGGYSQAVFRSWFQEEAGWLEQRISDHQAIRDELVGVLTRGDSSFTVRPTEGGSYIYPELPSLSISIDLFVHLLRRQAGVIVTPGSEFTVHPTRRVRLNFSQDRSAAINAVKRMVELVERYKV